jgi:hypothetical protein
MAKKMEKVMGIKIGFAKYNTRQTNTPKNKTELTVLIETL